MAEGIPDGFHTLTPHLIVRDAAAAIEFYRKAFGAEELRRLVRPGDPRLAHAEIKIGDSVLMLCDEVLAWETRSPKALGGTPVTIHMYVRDVDSVFLRAIAEGARPKVAPRDMFWGDRYAGLIDPFGHEWTLASRRKELTPEQIAERARRWVAPPPAPAEP